MSKKYRISPIVGEARKDIFFGDPKNSRRDSLFLGEIAELGGGNRKVYFDYSAEHVVSIVGKRGSGKSYTLGSMLEAMTLKGNTDYLGVVEEPRGVILFDPLNIFWTSAFPLGGNSASKIMKEQFKATKKWKLDGHELDLDVWVPIGDRHPLMPDFFKDFTLDTADFKIEDWAALLGLDIVKDTMGQLLFEAHQKVTEEGYTTLEGIDVLGGNEYSIDDLVDCVEKDEQIAVRYQKETKRGLRQRLGLYASQGLLSSNGTKVTELLTPGKLSVILLNGLPPEWRMVVVAVLTRKIIDERATASSLRKRLKIDPDLTPDEKIKIKEVLEKSVPRSLIAIDEAQNAIPSERKTIATETLVRLVREGRNIGLSFAITTQQPTAIDNRIMAQVDTFIIHKLAVQADLDSVMRNIKSALPKSIKLGDINYTHDELIRSLDQGQAVVSSTETTNNINRSFPVNIRPRVTAHGGFED